MKGNFQKSASRESSRNAFRGTVHFTHHWSSYCWCTPKHRMLACAGLLLHTPAAMWTRLLRWWGLLFMLQWTVVWSAWQLPKFRSEEQKGAIFITSAKELMKPVCLLAKLLKVRILMKCSVNVDNGLFILNGQGTNVGHLGQNHTSYNTTKRQLEMRLFGGPIAALVSVGSAVPLCVVTIFGKCAVLRCDGSR